MVSKLIIIIIIIITVIMIIIIVIIIIIITTTIIIITIKRIRNASFYFDRFALQMVCMAGKHFVILLSSYLKLKSCDMNLMLYITLSFKF